MADLSDVPGVPTKLDQQLRSLLLSLREHVRQLRGYDGNKAGRAVTLADLQTGGGTTIIIQTPGGGGGAYTPDYTPPPTPSGCVVVAGIDFIGYQTDPPTFSQGHGYARTKVYGAKWPSSEPTAPTRAKAVLIDEFVGQVGSTPTDPATRWCIWLSWVTRDGIESIDPAGGTNGFQATTGQDVSKLLEALRGQIKEDALFPALGSRIALIDAPDSTPGSVAARVKSEATARANADNALSSILTQVSATADGNTAAIQTEATTRANQTGALFAQYTVKLDVGGKVSGYGLASTGPSGAGSAFAIRADRFYVAAPAGVGGVGDIVPFAVQATPVLTPAGEMLPAGVYIDAAYIRNLEAALGRFQQAIITNAMIVSVSASRITSGVISVGNYIQSSNYVAGVSGWRIHGDGSAELAAASIRGKITANQFDGRGARIEDEAGNLILGAGNALALGYVPPGALNSNVTSQSLGIRTFKVVTTGGNGQHPQDGGGVSFVKDVDTGQPIGYGDARSYVLQEFSQTDFSLVFQQTYDVYGNGELASPDGMHRNAAGMRGDLNYICDNRRGNYIVVRGFDEPMNNRSNDGLLEAMCRCGASRAKFGSPNFPFRAAYILVGRAGIGEGGGVEQLSPVGDQAGAWAELTMTWAKGVLTVAGAGAPRSLGDYGFTGDLNATHGATIGQNLSGSFNQATWDVVMPNALIGASHIKSLSVGVLSTTMNGGSSEGIRMETNKLMVFSGGQEVVRVGYLY